MSFQTTNSVNKPKKSSSFFALFAKSLNFGRDLFSQKEVGIRHKRKHNNYNKLFDRGTTNGTS